MPVQKAITQSQMVAEGYHATASIYKIIASLKRTNETPILNITHNIIHLGKDPKLQINSLVPLICWKSDPWESSHTSVTFKDFVFLILFKVKPF